MTKHLNSGKKTVSTALPETQKIVRIIGSPNLEEGYLVWRFSQADTDGPYKFRDLAPIDLKRLVERLQAFERMNKAELQDAGCFHDVPIDRISKTAKKRLEAIKKDDADYLHGFHIHARCRLWCIKYHNIMSILWWDSKHEVYPTPPKNT